MAGSLTDGPGDGETTGVIEGKVKRRSVEGPSVSGRADDKRVPSGWVMHAQAVSLERQSSAGHRKQRALHVLTYCLLLLKRAIFNLRAGRSIAVEE